MLPVTLKTHNSSPFVLAGGPGEVGIVSRPMTADANLIVRKGYSALFLFRLLMNTPSSMTTFAVTMITGYFFSPNGAMALLADFVSDTGTVGN